MSLRSPSPPHVSGEPRSSPSPETDSQNNGPDSGNHDAASNAGIISTIRRSNRPARACTIRAASRLYSASQNTAANERKAAKKDYRREDSPSPSPPPSQLQQCSKIVTPLVEPPTMTQLPRWNLRCMWELASIFNFLHLFRPLLNISIEFSAEEFESALLIPNDTLSDIHMPLLKAIPPITRMALTRDSWITVLCRKLRAWWHWVADGDLPIVVSQGAEIEAYKSLDPGVRVFILKALCDIRVEQEDIKNYIDNSLKHGVHLSTFRKERVGGDSHGISYWYEDDPIIGHRLYREIKKTEIVQVKKGKARGSQVLSNTSYQWEAVATNFDEFQDVSEKLFSSKNRTEASVGKKLKINMLPEIEKDHKRKEKMLKKQHRQALLLDNYMIVDGLAPGRALRDRKPVTYTFDDYDQSINEAIKVTKQKQSSPEPRPRRESVAKREALTNGKLKGPSHAAQHQNFSMSSPKPSDSDYDEEEEEHQIDTLDRSNRRRKRPTRYSEKEFVEAVLDEADFDSDDDIVGEAVYDEEYLEKRKQRMKFSSGSEGDEEYQWDEDNIEEEEEDYDDEDEDSSSISEDSDEPRKSKQLRGRARRETRRRSVDEMQSGLRRSNRSTRNRINYQQYEASESETEFIKPDKSNASADQSDASENGECVMESEDSDANDGEDQEMKVEDEPATAYPAVEDIEQDQNPEKSSSPGQEEVEGVGKRHFLDLNELAPTSGFDDGPNTIMKDEDTDY
ncbi:hypothetical protein Lal_00023933 [Lupinus albus]|uniref:Putative transcription regulator DDT family n=1 Tax=Lupinus albus TaxID=3870 RepID=A0A6A4PIS3_LUPAL|nr:putative transcription regulator DDT family [Lupinus albus]KAF1887925.1 hypothetical protein Lal_00023933 [Lupinus albus]